MNVVQNHVFLIYKIVSMCTAYVVALEPEGERVHKSYCIMKAFFYEYESLHSDVEDQYFHCVGVGLSVIQMTMCIC